MIKIHTKQAPHPNGHYSQAVVHGGTLYISMQLPLDPVFLTLADNIEEQADQLFQNCRHILIAGGSSFEQVVSATIYVADMAHWPVVNRVFATQFGDHKPSRAVVCVKELHLGAKVGLQLIAAVEDCDGDGCVDGRD